MPHCRTRHLNMPALWTERFLQSNHNYITTKPCNTCSLLAEQHNTAELTTNQPYGHVTQGSAPSLLPWEPLSCGLCLAPEALTFHALGRGEAGSRRRPLPALGVAEAGRRHPVGRVLQQGIQQPKAICGFHSPEPQNKTCVMPHLKRLIFLLRRL